MLLKLFLMIIYYIRVTSFATERCWSFKILIAFRVLLLLRFHKNYINIRLKEQHQKWILKLHLHKNLRSDNAIYKNPHINHCYLKTQSQNPTPLHLKIFYNLISKKKIAMDHSIWRKNRDLISPLLKSIRSRLNK